MRLDSVAKGFVAEGYVAGLALERELKRFPIVPPAIPPVFPSVFLSVFPSVFICLVVLSYFFVFL